MDRPAPRTLGVIEGTGVRLLGFRNARAMSVSQHRGLPGDLTVYRKYRKLHLWNAEKLLNPETHVCCSTCPSVGLASLICMTPGSPEVIRILKLQGADIFRSDVGI